MRNEELGIKKRAHLEGGEDVSSKRKQKVANQRKKMTLFCVFSNSGMPLLYPAIKGSYHPGAESVDN